MSPAVAFQATAGFVVQAVDSLERVCYNGNGARCYGQDWAAASLASISVYKGLGGNNSVYLLLGASSDWEYRTKEGEEHSVICSTT